MRLRQRVIVVTGGGRGLGLAFARALASEGARLVVADLDGASAASAASELGDQARAWQVDVTDELSVADLFRQVDQEFGRLDVLVNNAGGAATPPRALVDTTLATWNAMLSVNLTGTFLCCRAVLPIMLAQRSGKIVNIASASIVNGLSPSLYFEGEDRSNGVAYTAAKAGVLGLTRALAREVGDANVSVNAVAPGMTLSEKIRTRFPADIADIVVRQQIFRRSAVPEDIAGLVVFLATDESNFITGQLFCVDGGWTMH